MSPEGNTTTPSSSSSAPSTPSGKRSRDPEDEVYVDNLNSHKRYLSEIMASSLNGLKVGGPLTENSIESPARDDLSLQYSPMSEDSDDARYYESCTNTCSSLPESFPTSPVSPYRSQKPLSTFTSGAPTTSSPSLSSSQPRQRGSDNEGRFPSSPSDICHSGDLRRAALLRSVQMRAQSPGSLQFESGNNMEAIIDERGYQIAECAPLTTSEGESRENFSGASDVKADKSIIE